MIYRDILIFHPEKHHVLNLAAGCCLTQYSVLLFVPLYSIGWVKLLQLLPWSIGKKIAGYQNPRIRSDAVLTSLQWQIKKIISQFYNRRKFYENFDLYVAQELRSKRLSGKVVVTLQDYMPHTVRVAKQLGMKIWSDQILNTSESAINRINSNLIALGLPVHPYDGRINDAITHSADLITVPSQYTASGLSDNYRKKTFLAPYGASITFSKNRNCAQGPAVRNTVNIVARAQSVRKGGHLLLQALQKNGAEILNRTKLTGLNLVILGALEPKIKEILENKKFDCRISVQSIVIANSEVARLYFDSDIFIMPSLSESMSLACVEAMHAGLPLIITKYCGVDRFSDAPVGIEIEPTVQSISSALENALSSKHMWDCWSKNSKELASLYTWENYEKSVAACAEKLLD
ncbi:MAG: glycosyltransferase family 4 protein [Polaromonas sp.]|nr:glycosyltransferase family 4 protein [Polaromonas sp.]